MKEVEFCLRDGKHPMLRFKMPASYITGETRDGSGRLAYVWLEAWLPEMKASAQIEQLGPASTYEERSAYMQANHRNLLRFSVGGYAGSDEGRARSRAGDNDRREQISTNDYGLAHYTSRLCESLEKLRQSGRPDTTRKCDSQESNWHYYSGRNGAVWIWCIEDKNNDRCRVHSAIREYGITYSIPRNALARWAEYDKAIMDLLTKYIIDK